MEKQTIGQFLSALRRSNGYTQQEVAEKLGISNKTVSCWERDSYSPDISVIPAIAELYGVTCDEILRAKRSTVVKEVYDPEAMRSKAEKEEKEAGAIFENMLARYENSQKIAVAATAFATAAAIIAAIFVLALSKIHVAAFGIVVPVSAASFFALCIVQYRINFAIPSDERTLSVRKKMYGRNFVALSFMALSFAFFLPFCANLEFDSRYFAYGIAFAMFAFFILIAARKSRRIKNPEYFSPSRRAKADRAVFATLFSFATAFALIFNIVVSLMPIKGYFTDHTYESITFDGLKTLLSSSDLPEEYELTKEPEISDQCAIYVYTVPKKDFNERDLEGYVHFVFSDSAASPDYTVSIFYPVWRLDRTFYDTPGSTVTVTENVVVYNRHYTASTVKYNTDGTYYLISYDLDLLQSMKRSRDFEYSMLCDAIATAFILVVYGAWTGICRISDKAKNKKSKRDSTALT